MKTAAILLFGLLPGSGLANDLSESEQLATTQAPLTETQRAMWRAGCALGPVQDETFDVAPGVSGPRLALPSFQVLVIMTVALDDPEAETFSISTYTDLPNGGIAAKDNCGLVEIHLPKEPAKAGDITKLMGFWLRDGVDLAADYPNTSEEIFARDQNRTAPGGNYVILDRSNPAVSDWYDRRGAAWLVQTGSRVAFVREKWLLLPIGVD